MTGIKYSIIIWWLASLTYFPVLHFNRFIYFL